MKNENKNNINKATDRVFREPCCRKLSVFASVCGVLSLLLHTYNYTHSFMYDVRRNGHNIQVESDFVTIEDPIDVKMDSINAFGTNRVRLKRDAMLVSIFFYRLGSYTIKLCYSNKKKKYSLRNVLQKQFVKVIDVIKFIVSKKSTSKY